MGVTCFIFILIAYFVIVSMIAKRNNIAEKSRKVTGIIMKILSLSPLLGIVIFTILFSFVLQGKLTERISHSLVVFALWVYATKFYVYLISYFKNKLLLLLSIIGAAFSVALAVLLTPLDRYISLVYSQVGFISFVLGAILFAFYYIFVFLERRKTVDIGISNTNKRKKE
ncbi:MAG: hypothetical protein ACI4M3_08705 [Acutalibacteraceae bacterium]